MSKNLVIVESPMKARTLTRILGSDYVIKASNGHVRDLPERGLGIDIKNGFEPVYEPTASRRNIIGDLRKALKGASHVYLATDPDREGEAIAWHLAELLTTKGGKRQFQRVAFHEITKPAVLAAFDHPSTIDMDRVNAQQARRVLDRLVGYQVSPLLWSRINNATSAGRVQSVALRLICEREAEIDAFEPREYWNLTANFQRRGAPEVFAAKLHRLDGDKVDISNADSANAHADDAEKARYQVDKVTRKPKTRRASPPFITSTLQQAASSNLRLSPSQTMRLAQQLYEGIDTGGGPTGLITYMRTDSVNVAREAQESARAFITDAFGADYVPAKPNFYRSRSSAQEAHEAIRPTDVSLTPEKAAKLLDSSQARLYALIWKRFMASQMAPAKMLEYAVEIASLPESAKHEYVFRASSTKVVFPGFQQVYSLRDTEDEEEKEKEGRLPDLDEGNNCDLLKLDREQKFTEPPPRFSEATLVRELESNGVGRPSTYASIVNTIKKRDYVAKDKGKLLPTDLGKSVNTFLVGNMPALFEVGFTARMEDELDSVEKGTVEWREMLDKFYQNFAGWLDTAKNHDRPDPKLVARLIEVFPDNVEWAPAEKVGRRNYDDQRFFKSLKTQVEAGKGLSAKQWQALIRLCARYEQQLPDLAQAAAELSITEALDECRAKQQAADQEEPDVESLALLKALEAVSEWVADTSGKRRTDDHKFYESLYGQARAGRKLSEAQVRALKIVVLKYRAQLPNFEELKEQCNLPEDEKLSLTPDQIVTLFRLCKEVKEWEEPSGKGRRRFDEHKFIVSLANQFKDSNRLSEKQLSVLKRITAKYKDQMADFESRTTGMDLKAPARRQAAEKTDVVCPTCGKANLLKRSSRGRTFYGCADYPKCKFTVNSLDKIESGKD